jgi:hypothetical protein
MARKKRIKDEEESASPLKKPKPSPPTRQSARTSATQPSSIRRRRDAASQKRTSELDLEEEAPDNPFSDSSSLTDPPSVITTPTPPSEFARNVPPRGSKRKPAQNRKATAKEHEEALNLFIRDDSDEEEASDASSTAGETAKAEVEINGILETEDEDEDWEDIDLSHKRQVSLEDLNKAEEMPDIEVTLERNQQSMRIKLPPLVTANEGIKLQAQLSGRSECTLTCSMCFVFLSMVHYGIPGLTMKSYRSFNFAVN